MKKKIINFFWRPQTVTCISFVAGEGASLAVAVVSVLRALVVVTLSCERQDLVVS
jgi:hypothetical protein